MSDPTIQTFCCHNSGKNEDMAVRIMNEFNTDSYNTVCLVSSTIGILGALFQILPHLWTNIPQRFHNLSPSRGRNIIMWLAVADLLASSGVLIRSSLWLKYKTIMPMPDDGFSVLFCSITSILPHLWTNIPQRFHNLSPSRGRNIIMWLAVADLLASSGVLIRSSLWLKYKTIMPMPDDGFSVLFCSITSAWTQYFYTATWFWTLFYAIDTWLTIKSRDSHQMVYHSVAWGLPAVTTGVGLSILYFPDAKCHNLTSVTSALIKILPNYCATYVPIALVMIVNPVMYVLAGKDVEMAVALPLAQFTSKERRVVDALRLKFFLINAVFYICWLPNLLNGILLWTMWFNMPVKVVISIWYVMALMNPMQALFNAMVYRKWSSSYTIAPTMSSSTLKNVQFSDEQSPLLGSEPPRLHFDPLPSSINNYSTL